MLADREPPSDAEAENEIGLVFVEFAVGVGLLTLECFVAVTTAVYGSTPAVEQVTSRSLCKVKKTASPPTG